jgi:UDP-GlcNAc:undecaprenyl-phosphate/decaprenyl-phosphate GlcNAc-1-phosphate transferase
MESNNLILTFILIIFGSFFYKYLLKTINKYKPKFLVDDQFTKPQAFHYQPISHGGGLCIFLSLLIVCLNFLLIENKLLLPYLSFGFLFFFLGFIDDLKISISPKIRLFFMIFFLTLLINLNDFYIEKTGIEFIEKWLQDSKTFSLIFVCLCFLFIINGTNLIDGYNGLLGIHSIIILTTLFLINYFNEVSELTNFLFFQIIILATFLVFNFPRAKVFLGDGGSYLLGTIIALSTIKTSIANPSISPFFFCIILFYLFFEVFFSFFRKLVKERRNPLHPDKYHLHMLIYKIILKKNKDRLNSNYLVSVFINLTYLILITPAIFMMNNGLFCKYYSLIFFVSYIFSYKISYEKTK